MGEHGNTITITCSKCKAMVPWGAEKCPGCGTALRSETELIENRKRYDSREITENDQYHEKIKRSILFVIFYFLLVIACIIFYLSQKK